MCQWAVMDAEVEVFSLFAGSNLQEVLSRMERGRKVQSNVPSEVASVMISLEKHTNTKYSQSSP